MLRPQEDGPPAYRESEAPFERNSSVAEVFAKVAADHSKHPAVISDNGELTYADIQCLALVVADMLRRAGVSEGNSVGVLCERGAEVPAAMLGILLAGCVFVPLEPLAPSMWNAKIASRSRCSVVLTNGPEVPDGFKGLRIPMGPLAPGTGPFTGFVDRGPLDAASIMYTSGSSGAPKGVVIPHRAILRLCRNSGFMEFGPGRRFLHASPLAFDASTLEIWAPLLNGGCVVMAPPGKLGLREMAATIRERRVSACWLTAGLFHACVDELPALFDPLDVVLTGGDVVSPKRVAKLRARLPGLRIINGYGPTESTTFATTYSVGDPIDAGPLPIGRPIANTGVCVLGQGGRLASHGEIGEIVITGDGLALGYLEDPDETARRFIHIDELGGIRGYLTGDRGRIRQDGIIEFCGRVDNQVKLRGYRVEPGEIEARLAGLAGVRESAVIVSNRSGESRLHAFVIMEPMESWPRTRVGLFRQLRAQLPEHMVPSTIALRTQMPVGATGKLDRSALRAMVDRGTMVDESWERVSTRTGSHPLVALVRLGLELSHQWHPLQSNEAVLHAGEMELEFAYSEVEALGEEAMLTHISDRLRACPRAHERPFVVLRDPEGHESLLVQQEGLRLVLDPSTSERTMGWRVSHATGLVESLFGAPGNTPGELSVTTLQERDLIGTWNDTGWCHGLEQTLPELFEQAASRLPVAEALRSEDRALDFGHVLRRTNAIASGLLREGVAAGDRVAIYDDRSLDALLGVLGILRCGAVCVPLDPQAPAARTLSMLEDAGVSALLARAGRKPSGPTGRARPVEMAEGEATEPPAARPKLGADAFVLFTSGSTGRPKGVPIRHESLLNRVAWMNRRFGLNRMDVVLQKNRLTWDVSIWEYLWPLAFGGRCYVASGSVAADPARVHACIRSNGVTIAHFVPSLTGPMARIARTEGPVGLRLTICSGEALGISAARQYIESVGGELYNLYGPTEAAIDVTCGRCDGGDENVTIGRPVENTQIHITDAAGRECPIGVIGELGIAGIQVSHRYCKAPGVDSAAFRGDLPGATGWSKYRTGDLARWREDGEIEFVGRTDAQVKICGIRVELEEIESALMKHPELSEAVTCRVGDGIDAQLVAVCVGIVERAGNEHRIRDHLRQLLDAAVVPTRFVWVPSIPRLPNGKLDRRAAQDLAQRRQGEASLGQDTPAGVVADVWCSLLGSRPSSEESHFLEAGGNSLTFLRLMLEVEERLGIEIPAAPVMAVPTFGRITSAVNAIIRDTHRPKAAPSPLDSQRRGERAGTLVRLTYGDMPLVALPHIGGTLGFLTDVSSRLAGEVAMYGVSARGLFDGEAPLESVQEMINGYLDLILDRGWKRVCVLGFSSGAVIGLGLAAALQSHGITVPLLVLADSSPWVGRRNSVRWRLESAARRMLSQVPGVHVQQMDVEDLGQHVSESQRNLMRVHYQAVGRYSAPVYSGRSLVIVAGESGRSNGVAAWRRVLGGPGEELIVDATHMGMWREPHACIMAGALLSRLRNAQIQGGGK